MENKHIEVEIKLPLNNVKKVKDFLNKNAELVSQSIYQKDSYYVPTHRNFLAEKYPFEWLRLRESPKGTFITYKHFYPEGVRKTDYCDEFETSIGDIESMEKIFESLDFKPEVVVEKLRSTWMFENVEIVIDDVTDLGVYMELEAKGDFESPQEAKSYLYEVLNKIDSDVGEEDLRGYPFKILENKGYQFGE